MTEIEKKVEKAELSQEAMRIGARVADTEASVCQLGTIIFSALAILIFSLSTPGGTKAIACIMATTGALISASLRGEAIKRTSDLLAKIK